MATKKETKVARDAGDNEAVEVNGERLLGFIKKIEKIEAKKANILQELREEYANAKACEFDTKMIRRLVKDRAKEPEKLKEDEDLYDLYKSAIGMLEDEQ